MATPHLPSLETLALAIEVQGSHAPDHIFRSRLYALELATRLGVDQAGQEILQHAAVFHDVCELAVPRSILSKSGDLTPQESEKMKTHAQFCRPSELSLLLPWIMRSNRSAPTGWSPWIP